MSGVIIFAALLCFVIGVAISRWIFRIDDIVKRLDKIIKVLESQKGIQP
jgi:hypothetical protein